MNEVKIGFTSAADVTLVIDVDTNDQNIERAIASEQTKFDKGFRTSIRIVLRYDRLCFKSLKLL